ncbi:MAG: glycosyltransferase [Frankiales bacterium]|nr:glycosyltransferase [Frankiales bacterium]
MTTDLVSVVVPVKDGTPWLRDCLEAVLREAQGSPVVVVDDGSTDGSAELAEQCGATVIRGDGAGPYHARNLGWRSTSTELVVFTDVRCRPRPGWLAGLVRSLDDREVAVAGGDVIALAGEGAATRYVAKWQPLAPQHGLGHAFLPFLPTCNLITRRRVLTALDGFREIRSGGDLDFSWRAQLAGLGTIAYASGAAVEWVPRATVREVRRQWYRYGAAKPTLWESYREHGLDVQPPMPLGRFGYHQARLFLRGLRDNPIGQWDVELVSLLCQWEFRRGYRQQWRSAVSPG